MPVTKDQLIEWATTKGFARTAESEYSIAYKKVFVVLRFLKRNVRVVIRDEANAVEQAIGSFNLSNPHVRFNRYGMIDGIGLSGSFAMRLPSPATMEDMPSWFSPEYSADCLRSLNVSTDDVEYAKGTFSVSWQRG